MGVDIANLLMPPGVQLTGYLADVRPTIAESWVSLVPLRQGGGTRLKILEAMALGTPVVSTSKGAEGLETNHGENILLADTAAEFAQRTIELLRSPELRARLVAGGRRLVESRYDWRVVGADLRQVVNSAAEQSAGVRQPCKPSRSTTSQQSEHRFSL
jgi:polysaccharide biosynthesis protein PslH